MRLSEFIPIINKQPHKLADKTYFLCVSQAVGSRLYYMFTIEQLDVARERAAKNFDDIPDVAHNAKAPYLAPFVVGFTFGGVLATVLMALVNL